ncbi:MAG: permease [Rhodospirillales bacterium]|nr:permease [Rhodospirillales bacterium]
MPEQALLPLLIGAAALASFASGLAGFAFAVVGNALFLPLVAPELALPLILVGSVVTQALSIAALRRDVRWRRIAPMLAGGLLGIPVGIALLQAISADLFEHIVGAFLIVYCVLRWVRGPARQVVAGRGADAGIGMASGVLGGLAGLSGVLPTIWCRMRGWPRNEQRAVYQPFILVMQVATLIYGGAQSAFAPGIVPLAACMTPAFLLGGWLGLRAYHRINERQFGYVLDTLIFVSGVALVL